LQKPFLLQHHGRSNSSYGNADQNFGLYLYFYKANFGIKIRHFVLEYKSNAIFVGRSLQWHEQLTSTNDYLLAWLGRARPPEGTAVIAGEQTAGRGQLGSRWLSAAGQNLTVSFVFYPSFLAAHRQFQLNMAVSLAVADCVDVFLGDKALVKWPNDIYVNEKKISGILIQNTLNGRNISASVVGIGLNVRQMDFGPDLPHATSLALQGSASELTDVAARLFECLERRYLQLRAGRVPLAESYVARLFRAHEDALFKRAATGEVFLGRILGVEESGKIIVLNDGKTEGFDFKGLEFVL
jgi:BirA family biotin operon repressor/biotin-[acetyl-CoA-carboxylase] ligase